MKYEMTGSPFRHFSIEEIVNTQSVGETQMHWTDRVMEHGQMMDELRDVFGGPLHSSSWFRAPLFNRKIGGASNSAHLDGEATDIDNIDTSNEKVVQFLITAWKTICAVHHKIGGIEIYGPGKKFKKGGMHFDSHSDKFGCKTFRLKDNR